MADDLVLSPLIPHDDLLFELKVRRSRYLFLPVSIRSRRRTGFPLESTCLLRTCAEKLGEGDKNMSNTATKGMKTRMSALL
jgi:hypothetical protein